MIYVSLLYVAIDFEMICIKTRRNKILPISSVWRIRQIKFQKQSYKMQAFYNCFLKFCLALNNYINY